MQVLYSATYNIAYQLSFRWNRDSAAGEPMDGCLPRAKGDLPQEAYTYVSLPSKRHIRILCFKQPSVLGLRGSVIECDLLLVPLNKPSLISSYRAISYSWDGQRFDRYILCGGKKLAITKNCEDILRQMLRHARLFIWIDAICIDQGSREEKAIQVPLMTKIYGRAYLVNVWLGLPAEGTGLVFSYVWLFWCCLSFPEPARTWLTKRLYGIIATRGHTPYFLGMLHRSWWRRVWTIQESVLAPDSSLLVNCGRSPVLNPHSMCSCFAAVPATSPNQRTGFTGYTASWSDSASGYPRSTITKPKNRFTWNLPGKPAKQQTR
ncbi:hypothetical protein RB594_004573 [Gaeumannomyces avenae]